MVHYRTEDRGKTWRSFEVPAPLSYTPKPLSFHSDKWDRILYQGTVCDRVGWNNICTDVVGIGNVCLIGVRLTFVDILHHQRIFFDTK